MRESVILCVYVATFSLSGFLHGVKLPRGSFNRGRDTLDWEFGWGRVKGMRVSRAKPSGRIERTQKLLQSWGHG